ncbi:MAG TPA: hypothetical protein VMY35_08065 [Phycisphaerae bacterium]|nr:hypothetical protein [Phycisphaerae bacterium]
METAKGTTTEPTSDAEPIRVVRVRRGSAGIGPDGMPQRTFSVTLSRPAGGELGIVATASDPEKPALRIPPAGSPHPDMPGLAARPPEIHPVGLREKDGAWITHETCFYNVLARYERKC